MSKNSFQTSIWEDVFWVKPSVEALGLFQTTTFHLRDDRDHRLKKDSCVPTQKIWWLVYEGNKLRPNTARQLLQQTVKQPQTSNDSPDSVRTDPYNLPATSQFFSN